MRHFFLDKCTNISSVVIFTDEFIPQVRSWLTIAEWPPLKIESCHDATFCYHWWFHWLSLWQRPLRRSWHHHCYINNRRFQLWRQSWHHDNHRFSVTLSNQYRAGADSRFALSQWETALLCNDVSYWLGANIESALMSEGRLSIAESWWGNK